MSHEPQKLPRWLVEFYEQRMDRQKLLLDTIDISAAGISALRAMPEALRALGEEEEARVQRADLRAGFAEGEVSNGFSTVAGFGVTAMWSWLESFIIDFTAVWLGNHPSALDNMKPVKVRIDLAEYGRLTPEDRALLMVETLDREISGPLRKGVGRFVELLDAVGLELRLPSNAHRDLFELQQVRHCLVHRFGIADARLVEACPWLAVCKGELLKLSLDDFFRFGTASTAVALETLYAASAHYGIPRPNDDAPAYYSCEEGWLSSRTKTRGPAGAS